VILREQSSQFDPDRPGAADDFRPADDGSRVQRAGTGRYGTGDVERLGAGADCAVERAGISAVSADDRHGDSADCAVERAGISAVSADDRRGDSADRTKQ
jgi:hypothetical protein